MHSHVPSWFKSVPGGANLCVGLSLKAWKIPRLHAINGVVHVICDHHKMVHIHQSNTRASFCPIWGIGPTELEISCTFAPCDSCTYFAWCFFYLSPEHAKGTPMLLSSPHSLLSAPPGSSRSPWTENANQDLMQEEIQILALEYRSMCMVSYSSFFGISQHWSLLKKLEENSVRVPV